MSLDGVVDLEILFGIREEKMGIKSERVRGLFRVMLAASLVFCLFEGVLRAADEATEAEQAGPRARNVILFIGDGMGFNHVAAASCYMHAAEGRLVFEGFPVRLAASTYAQGGGYDAEAAWVDFEYVKRGATDSAAAGSALATGEKTWNGAISVVGSPEEYAPAKTVLEAAEGSGRATGVVTSVQFSHATPAVFAAHNPDRDQYEAIGREMIMESAADVIMGCGHPLFDRNSEVMDEVETFKFAGGADTWRTLVAGEACADADGDGVRDGWALVQDRADFQALAEGPTPKRVCGIAKVETTLQQKRSGDYQAPPFTDPLNERTPTLAEMTRAALNVLDEDPDGLFLMVEGGAIDWAAHSNQSGRMIEETLAFADAVAAAVAWVEENSSWDDTLIIVTADHETGYLTGAGSGPGAEGQAPVWNPIGNRGKGTIPGMEWHSGSHTNSLVPVYAKGAGAAILETLADERDPVHGRYMDNTEIALTIFDVMKAE